MKRLHLFGVGRVGAAIAQGVIVSGEIDTLFLYGRDKTRIESICKSFRIYGFLVGSNTQIEVGTIDEVRDKDVVIIAIKDDYDPRNLLREETYPKWYKIDVRTIGLKRDGPLVRAICNELEEYRGKVVVVTNPVDIVAGLIQSWCPNATVIGMGVALDAARMLYMYASKKTISNDYRSFPVGGEHGGALVPLRSIWGECAEGFVDQAGVGIQDMLRDAKEVGPNIVKGLGYTVHDCAVVFIRDILSIVAPKNQTDILTGSIGKAYRCIGRPFQVDSSSNALNVIPVIVAGAEERELEELAHEMESTTHKIVGEVLEIR